MVDLHSHVLFDIDDGAQDVSQSIEILKRAQSAGIRKMMVTPHFTIGEDVEAFVEKRNERLSELKAEMVKEGLEIELKAGAEVYITDELFSEDSLKSLVLGDSNFLLAEFRYHLKKPEQFLEYIDEIQKKGVDVLVAHPERYSFLMNDPRLLDALLSRDVLLQVNGISLFEDSEEGEFARFLVKKNLAYAIASDIHHPESKRMKAMAMLNKNDDIGIVKKITANPDKIFRGVDINV